MLVASPTVDSTRFPNLIPTTAPSTPQILVAGSAQGIVVPQGGAAQGVQTVVVILVTATPAPPATPRPSGPTYTPGPTNTPGPPTATPTATSTPSPPVVVHVKINQANVRQGPGETYPLVTRLDIGTTVTVVGRNRAGNWWKICCVNNSDVWIADSVVTVEGPIWTVAEVTDIPPAPPAPPTPAPSPTPSLTPTYAWGFHLQQTPQEFPLGQNFFQVSAIIYDGATPLWGYKLKIRKGSTGQEWLSSGSESYWKGDTIQWNPPPTPNVDVKRNVKWDSNSVSVPMGDDVWEVTVTDGAGNPLSAAVRLNTSVAKMKVVLRYLHEVRDSLHHGPPPGRPLWPVLMITFLLAAASVSCSVGQFLAGDGGARSSASLTQTPRPTFTPARGAVLTMLPGPGQGVLGALPPGVTAVAPDAQSGQPAGNTNVILFATSTPGPQPSQLPTETSEPTITPTSAPTLTPSPTPYVVVSSATVNGRRGPGTSYELIGQAKQGQALMLMGRSAASDWWLVCCISNQPAWVNAEGVTPNGTIEGAPLLTPGPTPSPTLRPPPSATPSITPTPQPPFDIAQGPLYPIQRDDGVMTIWVKVFEGPPDNQKPLAGYVLKVFRNDVDVSKPAQSYAHIDFDHTSWNDPINDLKYNLKFELNNAGEVKWKIYLARPGGDRVSPVTEFTTLGDAYRNLVVYVAYWLAR